MKTPTSSAPSTAIINMFVNLSETKDLTPHPLDTATSFPHSFVIASPERTWQSGFIFSSPPTPKLLGGASYRRHLGTVPPSFCGRQSHKNILPLQIRSFWGEIKGGVMLFS